MHFPTKKDLALIAGIAALTPVALIFPAKFLAKLSVSATWLIRSSVGTKNNPEVVASALDLSDAQATEIADKATSQRLFSFLLFLKARITNRHFNVVVENTDKLRDINKGNGVVLWVGEFTFAPDAIKIGLYNQGFSVSHLSRPEHGFSSSIFGIRYLNPLRQNYELRFLRQRIIIEKANTANAKSQMSKVLESHGIVSIMASGHVGKNLLSTEFLGGRINLAGGAPSIAYENGARLVPVFAFPSPAAPDLEVHICNPISLDYPDKREAVRAAINEFSKLLESRVRLHPELWLQWPFWENAEPDDATDIT